MRGPNYEKLSSKFASMNSEIWASKGKYIADIEEFKVKKYKNYYSLWVDSQLVAYTSLINNTVDDVWVNPQYRGKKIFSKLLWFYKSRLGINQLMLGKIHSPQMIEVVKGLSRFRKTWKNIKTGEVDPFNISTMDQYYNIEEPTDWRLVLENTGDFSDWPMFRLGESYIKEDYTEIIK